MANDNRVARVSGAYRAPNAREESVIREESESAAATFLRRANMFCQFRVLGARGSCIPRRLWVSCTTICTFSITHVNIRKLGEKVLTCVVDEE